MHYVAERMHSITGKRALKHRAVCTKLSVFTYERCAKIILAYSAQKGLDKTELFIRVVFSFVVGNSDMHLKNFSLIETAEASGEYILSAAYDMLSTNVVIPDDKE